MIQIYYTKTDKKTAVRGHYFVSGFVLFQATAKQTRIEKAKEMLAQKDFRTYEIAEMVGIGDSRYFNKVFKKQVCMTPTEFRQQFIQNA